MLEIEMMDVPRDTERKTAV